jgi:hypothetical protein
MGGMLNKKVGGVPSWALGGAAILGVGVFWFMRKGKGVAGAAPSPGNAGTSQLPFIPVTQVTGLVGPGAGSTASGNAQYNTVIVGGRLSGNDAWAKSYGKNASFYNSAKADSVDKAVAWIPFGTKLKVLGPPVDGKGWGGTPVQMLPVDAYGKKLYVNIGDVDFDNQTNQNVGGPAVTGSSPWSGFAQPYIPAQYASTEALTASFAGVGGAGGTSRAAQALLDPAAMAASRLNTSPNRIRALNRLQPWWRPWGGVARLG